MDNGYGDHSHGDIGLIENFRMHATWADTLLAHRAAANGDTTTSSQRGPGNGCFFVLVIFIGNYSSSTSARGTDFGSMEASSA